MTRRATVFSMLFLDCVLTSPVAQRRTCVFPAVVCGSPSEMPGPYSLGSMSDTVAKRAGVTVRDERLSWGGV